MKQRVHRSIPLLLFALLANATPASAQGEPAAKAGLLTSVAQLAARLPDPTLVVIQAERDTAAGAGAQIPGARLLPLRAIVVERNDLSNEVPPVAQLDSVLESVGISNSSLIVIYGDPLAAARLFFTLDYMGLGGQASLLDGGLPAWKAANQPTATRSAGQATGKLEPRVQARLLIEVAEISARLGDPTLRLLDARPSAEFSGETAGDGITRPGHIPGARSFFWRTALTSTDPSFLKDVPALRHLLAPTGVTPSMELVTYCKTGVQASYLYFVLRYLGYAPRLYDGSFAEWSRGTERMVER